jgi:ferredoxin-NADP reductase/ferredoxin
MADQITIRASDGISWEVPFEAGQDVVTAAEATGMLLPAQCRQGTCGTCHAQASGDYALGTHSAAVLPDEDVAAGRVLLCRTHPQGPMAVTLPCDSSRVLFGSIPERAATITGLDRVADGIIRLRLQLGPDPDGGTGLLCDPGQFVELSLAGGSSTARAYSLANPGNWDGSAELYIAVQPGGWFSGLLAERLQVGDALHVRGPLGSFGLRDNGLQPRWFIAGGTGLAPLLAMLRRMAEWGDGHPARLFLGATRAEQVFGLDEISAVAAALPQLRTDVRVWQASADWEPPAGFCGGAGTPVTALAAALAAEADVGGALPDLYVCGPPAMVEAVREAARASGIAEDRVVVERFTAA